jgi:hypothetical protein
MTKKSEKQIPKDKNQLWVIDEGRTRKDKKQPRVT